jgi:hypothetical protein
MSGFIFSTLMVSLFVIKNDMQGLAAAASPVSGSIQREEI